MTGRHQVRMKELTHNQGIKILLAMHEQEMFVAVWASGLCRIGDTVSADP